jgi:hypothetical protein
VGWLDGGLEAGGMDGWWAESEGLVFCVSWSPVLSWSDGWLVCWVAGRMGVLWPGRLVAGSLSA